MLIRVFLLKSHFTFHKKIETYIIFQDMVSDTFFGCNPHGSDWPDGQQEQ